MSRVPLFPLGLVLLPRMPLPLHIFEPRYKAMFDCCIENDAPFGVLLQSGGTLQGTGCLARVENVINRYDDGKLDVLTVGTERFHVREFINERKYLEANVDVFHDYPLSGHDGANTERLVQDAISHLESFAREAGYSVDGEVLRNMGVEELSFLIATTDIFSVSEKQEFLETRDTAKRIRHATRSIEESRVRRAMLPRIRKLLGKTDADDVTYLFN